MFWLVLRLLGQPGENSVSVVPTDPPVFLQALSFLPAYPGFKISAHSVTERDNWCSWQDQETKYYISYPPNSTVVTNQHLMNISPFVYDTGIHVIKNQKALYNWIFDRSKIKAKENFLISTDVFFNSSRRLPCFNHRKILKSP